MGHHGIVSASLEEHDAPFGEAEVIDVEFIDVAFVDLGFIDGAVEPPARSVDQSESPRSTSPLRWAAVACVVLLGAWLVSSSGGADSPSADDEAQGEQLPVPSGQDSAGDGAAGDSAAGDGAAGDGAANAVPTRPAINTWPNPPTDRDPYVVRIPGPGDLPDDVEASSLERTSIVYVNSVGDPTVVSFDSGDVYEVDVAPIRVHETFAVEEGRVVSLEGVNSALDDATEDAIIFHTYRDVDPPGVGAGDIEYTLTRGPELCLSDASCSRPGNGLARVVGGELTAERFDQKEHWAIARILESWAPIDRWLVADDGFRIPAAVGVVWVISPQGGGQSSSSGLL